MSTDFSNLSSQTEAMQTTHYLQSSKPTSYHLPAIMYQCTQSTPPGHGYYDGQFIEQKEEVFTKRYDDLSLQHNKQGLSLSLGNQVPSSIQMVTYANSRVEDHTDDHHSQITDLQKAEEDFSFDLGMQTSSRFNVGSLYVPKAMNSHLKIQDDIVVGGMIYHSKYLKVVHELLDEFVNVHQYLKQTKKHNDFQSLYHNVSQLKSDCQGQPRMLMDSQTSASVSSNELSPTLQNDLHNKMTKLLSMLDEVDQKYQQYYMQMQCVESSFEIVAGLGAARRYTALALQTISAQFRCLHDAIKKQIQVVQKTLGEQGTTSNLQGVGLSRLRYLDQQMRQQRALQQFGMVRQTWRPQRGLPGTAVSILRAWLFEHFLHPYPNDSEKIMLARQTGLSRSQVANWFINARVRLWKPMIEEMYKQEFGDMGVEIRCSPESEQACGKLNDFEDTGERLHDQFAIKVTDGGKQVTPYDLSEAVNLSIQNDYHGKVKMVYETNKSWRDQAVNVCDQSGQNNNRRSCTDVSDAFNFSMLGAAMGTHVSLALGLQHSENESRPSFGGTQPGMDDTAAAASVLDTADYFYVDALNQHDRFSNSHILSDFVA